MRYPALLPLVLLPLLLAPLAGCQQSRATGTAPSDGFPAPDKEFVFNVAAQALGEQGFAPDRENSSKQTWTIVTHWKTSLQPFSGQGYRDRATVTIYDVPGNPGSYYTETQVARQVNNNMTQPGNPVVASWTGETRVEDLERVINGRIEMYFVQPGVSDRFRQRYGGTEGQSTRLPSDSFDRAPEAVEAETPAEAGPTPPYSPYGPPPSTPPTR
jgi:hypothetical protein